MSRKSFRTIYVNSGLYYFRIYGKKDGKTIDIYELEKTDIYEQNTMHNIHDKIKKMFKEYLIDRGIALYEMSYQVEPFTRNNGPLIDYTVKTSNNIDISIEYFKPNFTIVQDNGWTIYVQNYGYDKLRYEVKKHIKPRNQKYYNFIQMFAFISQLRTIGRTRKFKDELLAKIHISVLKY